MLRFLGLVQDSDERRTEEKRLRERLQRAEKVGDSLREGIAELDGKIRAEAAALPNKKAPPTPEMLRLWRKRCELQQELEGHQKAVDDIARLLRRRTQQMARRDLINQAEQQIEDDRARGYEMGREDEEFEQRMERLAEGLGPADLMYSAFPAVSYGDPFLAIAAAPRPSPLPSLGEPGSIGALLDTLARQPQAGQ